MSAGIQALRGPLKLKLDTLLIVVLVAIGVALSTTAFVVVDSVLLADLPYRNARELVHLWCVAEQWGIDEYPFSWENFLDYRAATRRSFSDIAANRVQSYTLEASDRPRSIPGARVTANFLDVLGLEPLLGQGFEATSSGPEPLRGLQSDRQDVALIGYELWQEELGGAADIAGKTVRLDGTPYTILGVLPRDLRYPTTDTQILVPLTVNGLEEDRAFHFLRLVARLRPGVSRDTAEAAMTTQAARLAEAYPDATGGLTARVVPLKEQLIGNASRSLSGIYAAIQLLFLIACGNVAGLLLASGLARQRELSLRLALGASQTRLLRQLLWENVTLSLLGGLLGVGVAALATAALTHLDPGFLPRAYELRFDPRAAGYAVGTTLLAVLLFGLGPALLASRARSPYAVRGSSLRGVALTQRWLVGAQVAVTLLLLFGGGALAARVAELAQVETGFDTDGIVNARAALTPTDYADAESQRRYAQRALAELEKLPGVTAVGALSRQPFSPGNATLTAFRPDQEGETDLPNANYRVVTPGLFETLGVKLLDGRDISWLDDAKSSLVVIISNNLAQVLWPNRPATGQLIRLGATPEPLEVVGVVPDLRLVALDQGPGYAVYVPIEQNPFLPAFRTPNLLVRSDAPVETLIEPVRRTLQAIDTRQAILKVAPLSRAVDDWLGNRRLTAQLVLVVAGLALLLALVGLYATLSFALGQRRSELAICTALGAAPSRLLRAALSDGLRPVLIGIVLGLLGSWALSGWLGTQTGSSTGPFNVLVATALGLLTAALAAAMPAAWRAARRDPASELRRLV